MPRMAETVEELIEEIRGGAFFQEMRELALDVKAVKEYLRHLDTKLDIVHEEIEELSKSLRLRERLMDVERELKNRTKRNGGG
jgi:hypothetical protein